MKKYVTLFLLSFLALYVTAQIGLPIQTSLLPKNNLVVNYDFSKSLGFTRGSSTVNNIAGTASGNATIYNSPIFMNSLGLVIFNSTNQHYLMSPNLRTYFKLLNSSVQNSFTISLWIYPTGLNGVIVSEHDSQTLNTSFEYPNIEVINGIIKYRVFSGTEFSASTIISLNQWYHIAMVYDGTSVKGYLNGVLQGTRTYSRTIPVAGQFYGIGSRSNNNMGSGAHGNFYLSQFKLHNEPLTDIDILREYELRKSEFDYTIHSPLTNANPIYWGISSAWNNSSGSTGSFDPFGFNHFTPWLNSGLGWAAQTLDANQWITLNYDEPAFLKGVVIQGRLGGWQLVTKAHVETSLTGSAPWTRILSNINVNNTTNPLDDVRLDFPINTFAKSVRVVPVDYSGHITLRMGMIVKPNDIITDGLVLRLDPANIKSYQSSGTIFKDLTSNLSDFTLAATSPIFDPIGFFIFNGTNQFASRVNTSSLKPTSAISIEQWLNADDWNAGTSSSDYKCSLSCTAGGGYSHNIWNGFFYSYIYAGGRYLIPSASVNNFTGWHHFVTTFDGQFAKLYIDGSLASTVDYGSANKTMTYASNSIFLGAEAGASTSPEGFYWQGKIASTLIYNKSLNDLEVLQNYNVSKHRYRVQTIQFTTVGARTWTVPDGVTSVEYLVVAGGGGGANGYDNAGGGGGGGGMALTGNLSVTPGSTLNITVGDGGLGGANSRLNNAGNAGGNTIFHTITALGGGGGFGSRTVASAGASQVGNTIAPAGGGGSSGGYGGKGGGGATGVGSSNSGTTGGAGGAGFTSTISGISLVYGIGGAGANSGTQNAGTNGSPNTGNGGRAGGATSSSSTAGGKGGSGIVILKYSIF
jgi:hypothetical protein